ncbi:MinD/ParA family ATP-binding protein [Gallionella capsiferriformans]|jgi:flagellar biosynthesis protein FlhG|uniref:Putative MinD-related protein n=1 Tax=Gallionella capsiferriformans (strain ES-2) TaxID=395494 RepID=D9SEW6_GALCS|nr:AAA family ATPase [Gallionella capsiferriformans]ADL55063.1 putative MinD-related protein [Gallionella capsiferriformans ES-2]
MHFDVDAEELAQSGELSLAQFTSTQRLGEDDQAEGLRRLLVGNRMQVITLVAGKSGMGRTSVTLNLATALASAGRDVLVLDENPAPNNLTDSLGLFARHDLLDVVQGKCQLQDVLLPGKGFAILPVSRLMRALEKLKPVEQKRMEKVLSEVSAGVDVMLVDAAMLSAQGAVSASLASGVRVLVVMDATASGITESYSLIKRLALENARLRFEVVVNKVANEEMARLVFGNMEKVARTKLAARLEYLGYIPQDDRLKRSTQLSRSVVESYPASSSAKSCIALSQSVLQKTMRQDEMEGGISQMMKNLIRQLSRQHDRSPETMIN